MGSENSGATPNYRLDCAITKAGVFVSLPLALSFIRFAVFCFAFYIESSQGLKKIGMGSNAPVKTCRRVQEGLEGY